MTIAAHASYALQLSLGFVFLLAAVSKLRSPSGVVRAVTAYQLLPAPVARVVAPALVVVESFVAVAFLTGVLVEVALPLAITSLLAFLVAIGINLRRGQRVPCGCFGDPRENISLAVMIRLLLLLALSALLVVLDLAMGTPLITIGSLIASGVSGLGYALEIVTLAAFLIVAGLWLLKLPELISMSRHATRLATDSQRDQSVEAA